MISHLLMKSSLQAAEYVLYEPEQIQYKSQIYQGVKSNSFLSDDWQIVTLERLFKTICNESLTSMVWRIPEVEDRLKFLIDQVERITGLQAVSYTHLICCCQPFIPCQPFCWH